MKPMVSMVMGSDSDLEIMNECAKALDGFGVAYEIDVTSAHRAPKKTSKFASEAAARGIKVIIAAAGGAAHLAGVIAAETTLPVIGVYDKQDLRAHWRVATIKTQTVDEYGVLFRNLFSMDTIDAKQVRGIIISSVVPPLDSTLRQVCEKYFKVMPLFVEPGVKTGMPVKYENPAEVGADRIVNGVAAFEKHGGPCIVVDFGTATTFDAISKNGDYLGGIIAPGLGISADALFERTARLPRIDIRKPDRVVGSTTVGSV